MTSIVEPYPQSQFPSFNSVYIPDLPGLSLSDEERTLIARLQMKAWRQRSWMLLTDSYYRGMQVITNLGISIPPELEFLRVVLGWPKAAIDPYVERLGLDSFRVADALTADQTLADIWLANGMEAEQSVAFLESLVMGRAWYTIGTNPEGADQAPRICVESPLNIACLFDGRTGKPREGLQSYWEDDRRHAALYRPDQTVYLAEDDNRVWQIVERDKHGFGMLPLIRQANRPRAADRDGSSEITPELMSLTDQGCRTLLNLSVAGEFYSVPQKLILGASEEDFVGTDGQQKSAWDTYVSHVLALQRDEEGELPQIFQFKAYDPSVYTKVLELLASQAAGIVAATPQDLGLYTQGNPVSAEAAQVSESRRDRRSHRMMANFGVALVEVGQMAMRFANNGDLPAGYDRLKADWREPELPNFVGTADGLTKYMVNGSMVPWSDVALKRAGFSEVERRQMRAEIESSEGRAWQFIAEVASSLEAKAERAVNSLAKAVDSPLPDPTAAVSGGTQTPAAE